MRSFDILKILEYKVVLLVHLSYLEIRKWMASTGSCDGLAYKKRYLERAAHVAYLCVTAWLARAHLQLHSLLSLLPPPFESLP